MRDSGRGFGMVAELSCECGLMDVSIYRRCSFPSLFIILRENMMVRKKWSCWAKKTSFLLSEE